MAVTNSYQSGLDWWQPFLNTTAASFTATNLTIPALTYSWVGSGGSIGTQKTCNNPGGTVTITGGTASGNFYVWMNADCSLSAQFPTGTTASGSNITVTTANTPGYPTYSYVLPTYSTVNSRKLLRDSFGAGNAAKRRHYQLHRERSWHVRTGAGERQWLLHGLAGAIPIRQQLHAGRRHRGNFYERRSHQSKLAVRLSQSVPATFHSGKLDPDALHGTTNPCYFYDSACWNGGNYYWRSVNEVKQGKWVWQDGNTFGPFFSQVSEGECALHETFQWRRLNLSQLSELCRFV